MPVLLPDEYSWANNDEKELVRFAIEEAETETVLIWRYKLDKLEEINSSNEELPLFIRFPEKGYTVVLLGYTYFNIPVQKIKIEVIRDEKGFH